LSLPVTSAALSLPVTSAALSLPVTERITRDSLILPLHHQLTDADQDLIVGVLRGLAS